MAKRYGRRLGRVVVVVIALCIGGVTLCHAHFKQNPDRWLGVQLLLYKAEHYDSGRVHPELAKRISAAQAGAKKAGHQLVVITAYRPWPTQLDWYRKGLAKYGSAAEARRNVLPPWESMHVRGMAVDFAQGPASTWLTASNGRFGLCQRYANEPWHFEMNAAPGQPCPPMEADASAGNR